MKYIVITTKHHDGFAMFHSTTDRYNIFDATPFKRDPIAELAAACRKQRHQARLVLLAGSGLAPPRRRGLRRALGPGPGRQYRRLRAQHRRAPGARAPLASYGRPSCGGTPRCDVDRRHRG